MDRGPAGVLSPADQFFELSLLGLLGSGFLGVLPVTTDLVSTCCDLHNVGGDRGGS
jgi:hypothetical protein